MKICIHERCGRRVRLWCASVRLLVYYTQNEYNSWMEQDWRETIISYSLHHCMSTPKKDDVFVSHNYDLPIWSSCLAMQRTEQRTLSNQPWGHQQWQQPRQDDVCSEARTAAAALHHVTTSFLLVFLEFSLYDFYKARWNWGHPVTGWLLNSLQRTISVIVGTYCSILLFFLLSLVGDAATAIHAAAVKVHCRLVLFAVATSLFLMWFIYVEHNLFCRSSCLCCFAACVASASSWLSLFLDVCKHCQFTVVVAVSCNAVLLLLAASLASPMVDCCHFVVVGKRRLCCSCSCLLPCHDFHACCYCFHRQHLTVTIFMFVSIVGFAVVVAVSCKLLAVIMPSPMVGCCYFSCL